MNGTINKVILVGNLGKDPEVRKSESGALLVRFSMATSEQYIDKNSGKRIENTDWHDVVVWGNLAEIAEKILLKGMKVYVEGKIKKRSWNDKEGNKRYSVDVVANELTVLSKITPILKKTTEKSIQDLKILKVKPTTSSLFND